MIWKVCMKMKQSRKIKVINKLDHTAGLDILEAHVSAHETNIYFLAYCGIKLLVCMVTSSSQCV